MGEIINFLNKRAQSKYGRNPLEPRVSVPVGAVNSSIHLDEERKINGNIVNISAGGFALLLNSLDYDIERGIEIEKITIETTDGNIFETSGLVTHITPEIKEKEFTHRLGLGFKRHESPTLDKLIVSKADRQFDVLSKEEDMTRIVEDLVLVGEDAKIGIKIDSHTNAVGTFKKKTELKKISSFHIDFEDERYCMSFEVDKEFTFYFSLFRSFYLFKSHIINNFGNSIEVAVPDFFVKLMRRNTSRIHLGDQDKVYVSINHPFRPDSPLRKVVTDINEKGFSIDLNSEDSIFPVGITLHEITIEMPGKEPIKTMGRLVHIGPTGEGTFRCGIKFFERDTEKLRQISEFVFYKRFPLLFPVGKNDYDKVWELFDVSGYLDEKSRESFELVREESNPAWEKLDSSLGLLSRNIASTDGQRILGGLHLTRVYSDSWLIHHFCILPGHQRTITTSVYGGMIDHMLDSGAKYTVCYYNADKSWNQKNYDEFIGGYPHKEENYNKIYDLFEFDLTKQEIPKPIAGSKLKITEANDFDIKGIARYFEMTRKKIQIDAMDLSLDSLKLSNIGGKYSKYGLERARKFFVAKKGKEMAGFVMLDITSTGVNIYALMDSIRVYLIDQKDREKEEIIRQLTISALEYFKSIGKKTVLFYSNDKDISFLSPIKYQRLCSIVLWIAHRNCFSRYAEYNGALFGRIMARRKRIHEQSQPVTSDG